jgi:uncharacterized membrane protein
VGSIVIVVIIVFAILLLVLVFKNIFPRLTKKRSRSDQDPLDSLRILKDRYAKGEISEEEYHKMYNILIL